MASKLRKRAGSRNVPHSSTKPHYTGAAAVLDHTNALKDSFSYIDNFGEPYINYRIVGDRIHLPRARFALGEEDKRIENTPIDIGLQDSVAFRNAEQERVVQEMESFYDGKGTGLIVNASTGFGKTFIGCCGIVITRQVTLILITKSDLEDQWRDSLKKFLGLRNEEIGLIKGDTFSTAGCKVVIGYVQSIMKHERYPSWVYKQFGMVILDEVHLMAADVFVNCIWWLPAKYRLGLSATLDRSDGKQHVFKDHIGPKVIQASLLPMNFNVVVVRTDVMVPKSVYFKPGRTMQLNNYLGKHPHRQRLITEKIIKCYEKGRNIVCFADTLEHLDFAYECLIDAGVPIKDIGAYVGLKSNAKQEDKENLRLQAFKRIVLATYKMTQYGTDFPHWDTAFLMTPRSDVRQIVGRVLRELEGKKTPLVFDFVDPVRLLENYYKKRRKWYKQEADQIVGDIYGY